MKTLSERICLIVDQTGLSQTDFALSIGISVRSLRAYLADTTKPSVEAVIAIASLYDINCNWLLLGDGPMYRKDVKDEGSVVIQGNADAPIEPYAHGEKKKLLDKIDSMQSTINELIKTNNKLIQKYVTP